MHDADIAIKQGELVAPRGTGFRATCRPSTYQSRFG